MSIRPESRTTSARGLRKRPPRRAGYLPFPASIATAEMHRANRGCIILTARREQSPECPKTVLILRDVPVGLGRHRPTSVSFATNSMAIRHFVFSDEFFGLSHPQIHARIDRRTSCGEN